VSVRDEAAELVARVRELRDSVAADTTSTPLEKAKVIGAATATLAQLGKLTGELGSISEAKIIASPGFRRIQAAIVDALEAYPEALRAVAQALRELEG
jgi:hypothetical protein